MGPEVRGDVDRGSSYKRLAERQGSVAPPRASRVQVQHLLLNVVLYDKPQLRRE
jgi:hypothetical protein